MQPMNRVQCVWSGFPGAPGYSNFYLHDSATDVGGVKDLFGLMAGQLPASVTVTIPAFGDTFNDETGELIGTWEGTSGAAIPGSGVGTYAGPVGAVVNWRTASINRGSKVRGRTFLVPLAGDCFATDGTLVSADRTTIQSGVDNLIDVYDGNAFVWSRPRSGTGGKACPMTSGTVPDLAAVLRSRRD